MTGSAPVYLHQHLGPFASWLERPDITDIFINRSGEAWLESLSGAIEKVTEPALTQQSLERLARQIAAFSNQGVNREHPIMSATLPDGARVQVVLPPATRGDVAIAIRKHIVVDRHLADYEHDGSFESVLDPSMSDQDMLADELEKNGPAAALSLAVRLKRNILISGGTSTGKTTFLNALLREIPADERVILIEDAPELVFSHENSVGLLSTRSELGEARVSTDDLLNASLRMRPDRIILGEIRGREAFTFLRAINTGHPGSMSTIHADSPTRALEQLALLVLQTGTQLRREDVLAYVSSIVDVSVQLERTSNGRRIKQLLFRSTGPVGA